MPLELRFITPADPLFARAAELRFDVLHRPVGAHPDYDDSDPGSRHLVAVEGERVLGYGRLVLSERAAQLRHLAVGPDDRGRGLGRALAEELIAQARREGRSLAWVNARFTALGFWRHLGFREAGGLQQAEDTHLPHRRMELRL